MVRVGVLIAVLAACGPSERDAPDAGAFRDASEEPEVDPLGLGHVYAISAEALYRVDRDTLALTKVGDFSGPELPGLMIDIAIDRYGRMFGLGYQEGAVYSIQRIDPATAQTTHLSSMADLGMNGLAFVPAATFGLSGNELLVATNGYDDRLFRIDLATGAVTQLGYMGDTFRATGDLVSITGIGTFITVVGSPRLPFGGDRLVRLLAPTVAAVLVGNGIGFDRVWGLTYAKGRLLGFTYEGEILTIDPTTGAGTLVMSGTPDLWGAAVATSGPLM